ncbi:hypothetical protein CC80DRAFT_541389 [Byssothecium circinans]|uniref:Uncharacterized protein n=1 Tax=Byssothecium circinans TaxID=147558 RepID=A0A6A5UKL8_9PLEO|nr:hypothetical protein CC80DRAFT_541389 [Byssothecium circinans]
MGEQFTKDLRSRLEHQNFNDLLVDPEYIDELKRNPPELSKTSLENLNEIVKRDITLADIIDKIQKLSP